MKKTELIILILVISIPLAAIFDDYEPSPRARAMGGTFYAAGNDPNAIFYNPAMLRHSPNSLLIGYSNLFDSGFVTLSSFAFSMQLPRKFGNLGIGMMSLDTEYLGVNLLSEKTYSLAHSINLMEDIHSQLNLGYTLNLYNLDIADFGNQSTAGINIGLQAILHTRTQIGMAVYNLNNPTLGLDNSHELPRRMAFGISYQPYTDVFTNIELKKALDGDTEIHMGTEILLYEIFTLRFGARTNPNSFSAGARFDIFNVVLDYAVNTHTIGLTHHFGLGYKF
jgi:hypothetical protein